MSKTYVTNMNHHLDESGEVSSTLPPETRKIASFHSLLIDEATEAFPADDIDSGIRCFAEDCMGSIRITLLSRVEDLTWRCPKCDLEGVISHWQSTKWDRCQSASK